MPSRLQAVRIRFVCPNSAAENCRTLKRQCDHVPKTYIVFGISNLKLQAMSVGFAIYKQPPFRMSWHKTGTVWPFGNRCSKLFFCMIAVSVPLIVGLLHTLQKRLSQDAKVLSSWLGMFKCGAILRLPRLWFVTLSCKFVVKFPIEQQSFSVLHVNISFCGIPKLRWHRIFLVLKEVSHHDTEPSVATPWTHDTKFIWAYSRWRSHCGCLKKKELSRELLILLMNIDEYWWWIVCKLQLNILNKCR